MESGTDSKHGNCGARTAQEDQDHHPVSTRPMVASLVTLPIASFDEDRLVEDHRRLQRCRYVNQMLDCAFMPSTMVMVLLLPPCLKTGT
jgi:hypothetical protein